MLRAKNIPLGIISNIISRGQVPYSLESYGLTEYFNPVILSATYGKRKPHPGIFRHACEKAGVDIRDAMYVGNSPSKDIDGAKNAGMGKTVLIEYFDNDPHDTGAKADFTIKDRADRRDRRAGPGPPHLGHGPGRHGQLQIGRAHV